MNSTAAPSPAEDAQRDAGLALRIVGQMKTREQEEEQEGESPPGIIQPPEAFPEPSAERQECGAVAPYAAKDGCRYRLHGSSPNASSCKVCKSLRDGTVNGSSIRTYCSALAKSDHWHKWSREDKAHLAEVIRESAWDLAQQKDVSIFLQQLVDHVGSQAQALLAAQFKCRVKQAWTGPSASHSNYVLQKMITSMLPRDVEFILEAMVEECDNPTEVLEDHPAMSEYGCRVLQRVVEHFDQKQYPRITRVMEWIAENAYELAKHQYGTHVIQGAMEQGLLAAKDAIASALLKDPRVSDLAQCKEGSFVVQKIMWHCSSNVQQLMAEAVVKAPKDVVNSKFGSFAFKLAKTKLKPRPEAHGGNAASHGASMAATEDDSHAGAAGASKAQQEQQPPHASGAVRRRHRGGRKVKGGGSGGEGGAGTSIRGSTTQPTPAGFRLSAPESRGPSRGQACQAVVFQ